MCNEMTQVEPRPTDNRARKYWGLFATLLLTLPALWPLLRAGFLVTDDGRFHVYRIAALADAWQHGALYPRLFPDFGFGYGQAVLNYYAPLSYAPGALLSVLGVSPDLGGESDHRAGVLAGGVGSLRVRAGRLGRVGRRHGGGRLHLLPIPSGRRLRAAGAIPEFMAFIWLPLILWATPNIATHSGPSAPNPATDGTNRTKNAAVIPALGAALAWAGLVLTHNLPPC